MHENLVVVWLVMVIVVVLPMCIVGPRGCRIVVVVVLVIIRHATGVLWRLSSYPVKIVWVITVHAQEVFLDVVGTVKLFLAHITLERLLFAMDVLVAGEQVAPVCGIWAERAAVSLVALVLSRGRPRGLVVVLLVMFLVVVGRRSRRWWRCLHPGLESLEELGDLLEDGVLLVEGVGTITRSLGDVVLAREVHPDTAGPGAGVRTLRTLEHSQVGVGAQPVLRHPR